MQAEQVRQVKKFESGMVVNPLTIGPDAKLVDALELMKAHGISGIPVVEGGGNGRAGKLVGILTNRDVRFATDPRPARLRADDQGQAGHRARRRVAGGGEAAAAPASHREAAGGRRQISLRRPDHREGHREGGRQSERLQGRAGAAARRRRDHGRRQGLRAHRDADRGRRRSRGGRHRARPFAPCARRGQPHQAAVQRGAGGRRQYRDRRRRQGADRCGRRRHQGRHRAGLDLHHAHRRRRRRAAAHRDHGFGRGGAEDRHAGDRRRRHQVFRRSRQGARGRRRLRDGRLAARRHRRDAGRGVPLSGPLVQELSRHGLGRRDGARLRRPLLPAGHQGHAEARAGRHRGPGALQGPGRDRAAPARRRPARRDGLCRREGSRGVPCQGRVRAHLRAPACARATCTT